MSRTCVWPHVPTRKVKFGYRFSLFNEIQRRSISEALYSMNSTVVKSYLIHMYMYMYIDFYI